MENISREQKLALMNQIKNQYNQNQYDLYNREHLIYTTSQFQEQTIKNNTSGTLRFRSVVAIILFLFVILMDSFGIKPLGYEMNQLFKVLRTDYLEIITDSQAPL